MNWELWLETNRKGAYRTGTDYPKGVVYEQANGAVWFIYLDSGVQYASGVSRSLEDAKFAVEVEMELMEVENGN